MHLALEEGWLKAGQRYWACFALRQVASRLSADSMRRLLAPDAQHSPRVEDGAILLVGCSPQKTTFACSPTYAHQGSSFFLQDHLSITSVCLKDRAPSTTFLGLILLIFMLHVGACTACIANKSCCSCCKHCGSPLTSLHAACTLSEPRACLRDASMLDTTLT